MLKMCVSPIGPKPDRWVLLLLLLIIMIIMIIIVMIILVIICSSGNYSSSRSLADPAAAGSVAPEGELRLDVNIC